MQEDEEEPDALDAFMADAVLPEVQVRAFKKAIEIFGPYFFVKQKRKSS